MIVRTRGRGSLTIETLRKVYDFGCKVEQFRLGLLEIPAPRPYTEVHYSQSNVLSPMVDSLGCRLCSHRALQARGDHVTHLTLMRPVLVHHEVGVIYARVCRATLVTAVDVNWVLLPRARLLFELPSLNCHGRQPGLLEKKRESRQ